jgi:DNA-binding NarL/FixJ family response regulator
MCVTLKRFLIVEDHPLVVAGLRTMLSGLCTPLPHIDVLSSLDETNACQFARYPYDYVFLDLGLPKFVRLEALDTARNLFPRTRIVVVSGNDDPHVIRQAHELGAYAYIVKTLDVDALQTTFLSILNGDPIWPPMSAPDQAGRWCEALTKAERRVLHAFMPRGAPAKEIARDLKQSPATVKQHLYHIMQKANVHRRGDLLLAASRLPLSTATLVRRKPGVTHHAHSQAE